MPGFVDHFNNYRNAILGSGVPGFTEEVAVQVRHCPVLCHAAVPLLPRIPEVALRGICFFARNPGIRFREPWRL